MSDKPRIIASVDFGTTFSGIAFVRSTEPENGVVIERWPKTIAVKVPSAISFSPSPKGCLQWGYDIDDDSSVIKWTKLEFEPKSREQEVALLMRAMAGLDVLRNNRQSVGREDMPQYLAMDAVDIATDYLTKLSEHFRREITQFHGADVLDSVPLDLVITHPAIWSDAAKACTYRAVMGAFSPSKFPRLENAYFVTEPEACALYTLRAAQEDKLEHLVRGDCMIVCDAGGGTVDVISYLVENVDPLRLKQVGRVAGSHCGAIFVEQQFIYTFLLQRLGEDNYKKLMGDEKDRVGGGGHSIIRKFERLLLERFEPLWHEFDGIDDGLLKEIQLPSGIAEENNEAAGIRNGQLLLTTDDIRMLFHYSLERIKELLLQQVINISRARLRARCIFLSGGFARNRYLVNETTAWASARQIAVETTANREDKEPWSAVARGALYKGLGIGSDRPEPVKKCKKHYGVAIAEQFKAYHHPGDEYIDAYDRNRKTKNQMKWLIRKGDPVFPGKSRIETFRFSRKFSPNGQTTFRVVLVVYNGDHAPLRLAEIPPESDNVMFVNMDYDLKDVPDQQLQRIEGPGGLYFKAYLDVRVEMTEEMIELKLICGTHEWPAPQIVP